MDEMHEHDHVGSVHEEALRLLGALGELARPPDRPTDQPADQPADQPLEGDCRYCPICQLVHVVRGTSPQVREHLSVAATALAQAAAELLASRPPTSGTDGTTEAFGTHGAGVERIDLDADGPA